MPDLRRGPPRFMRCGAALVTRDVEGFILSFLAVAGWCACRAGRLGLGGEWVDVAQEAHARGWWWWTHGEGK